MRIISGKHGRRRFDVPQNFNARPTTDFAKENLFNVLAQYLSWEGCSCLDLFAGTGSISAECLSRGASRVVSLELRRAHAQFIRQVAEQLGETAIWQVLQTDVFRFLRSAAERSGGGGLSANLAVPGAQREQTFDFIFADPPYKLREIAELPALIRSSGLLAEGGLFVVEHPKGYDFSSLPGLIDQRVYGSVHFSLFR